MLISSFVIFDTELVTGFDISPLVIFSNGSLRIISPPPVLPGFSSDRADDLGVRLDSRLTVVELSGSDRFSRPLLRGGGGGGGGRIPFDDVGTAAT